jgi:hypothetical protein
MILSFAVVSTRLTSSQYEAVDEYFHRNGSTVKSSLVEHYRRIPNEPNNE